MQDFQVVILAAGKGTRMKNDALPKVLHELDKKTLIEHVLSTAQAVSSVHKPIVVVGYLKEMVMSQLSDDCLFAEQAEQLGTGHAVSCALEVATAPHIMVLLGDMPFIKESSLLAIAEEHVASDTVMSMFTTTVPHFTGQYSGFERFGRIIRNADNQVAGIREYKDATPEERDITEVNPSIYVFRTDWLKKSLRNLNNDNAQQEYYLTDLVALAMTSGEKITTAPIATAEVFGINSREDLEHARTYYIEQEDMVSAQV